MHLTDAVVLWSPDGDVVVRRDDFDRDQHRGYESCRLAVDESGNVPESVRGRKLAMFYNFHRLVIAEGVDPQALHEALLTVNEYRGAIAPDIAGAYRLGRQATA
jgi:hypothetical protein